MGTTIDIVEIGFKLKNNSDAVSSKVFADLQKLQDAGLIKIDLDDGEVKQKLAHMKSMLENELFRVDLGTISNDFLTAISDSSKTAEQSTQAFQKFYDQLVAISSLPTDTLDKLGNMKSLDWNKILHINTDDIERQRQSIEQYVVSEKDAVEKLKELQKEEQALKTQKQSNPSAEVDKQLQRNYEEQIKYIERIKALKADVKAFDLNQYAQNKGFNLIPQDAINKVNEANSKLQETVQLIREIGKTDTASKITDDVLKAGIVRERVGSQIANYSKNPSGGGSNNVSADVTALKGSLDGLKGSVDNLKGTIDTQSGNLVNGMSNLGTAMNNASKGISDAVSNLQNTINNNPKPQPTQNPQNPKSGNGNNKPPTNNNQNQNPNGNGNDNTIDNYLADLEREKELETQLLQVATNRERVEEQLYLNATRRARTRNERSFLRGLYPGGGQDSIYDQDSIDYALAEENRIRYNARLANYTNRAQSMIDEQSYNKTAEYRQNLQEILDTVNQLRGMGSYDAFSDDDLRQAEQLEQRIQSIFNQLTNSKNKDLYQLADPKKLASMEANFEKYISNNSKGEKVFGDDIANIRNRFSELMNMQGGASVHSVNELATSISTLKVQMEKTGNTGKSFFDSFRSRLTNLATYVGSFMSFYRIIGWVKDVANTVVDLNTKMVELSKVSNTSIGDLERQFSEFESISKEVGGTISDTIQATADWSRNGLPLPDAKELARVAQIYKNIGDGIDINQANESLISTMRGFNIEAKDSMKILDAINEVANTQPIDSGGIGEALKRSAASFQAANTDLNEAIALITAANCIGGLHRNM